MKLTEIAFFIAMVLAMLFAAGCVSDNAPVNETVKETLKEKVQTIESKVAAIRFVELNMTNGTKVGGIYESESDALVSIIPLYTVDKDGVMTKGTGASTGFETSSISMMTNITDPKEFVNTTLAAQKEKASELATAKIEAAKEEAKQIAAEKLRNAAERIENEGSKNQ
jgi:hypothetical protein